MTKSKFIDILYSELRWDKSIIEKQIETLLSRVNEQVIYDLASKWEMINQKAVICGILAGEYNLNLLYLICEKMNGKYWS